MGLHSGVKRARIFRERLTQRGFSEVRLDAALVGRTAVRPFKADVVPFYSREVFMSFGLFNKEKKRENQSSSSDKTPPAKHHTPTPFRTTPVPPGVDPWVYSRIEPQEDEKDESQKDEE